MRVLIVTRDDHQVLDWASHRRDHISKEEMAEAHLAKWRDQDMPESLGELDSATQVETVHRYEAHRKERDQQYDRKVLRMAFIELSAKFDHGHLPCKAHQPYE